MHYSAYVLVPKADAQSSLAARQTVMTELSSDPTFVSGGERASSSICDWFVIGGRWSGALYPQQLRDEFYRQADQLNWDEEPGSYSNDFITNNREQLDVLWHELGGKYASPLTREQGNELGEEDDACLLDHELAEELNAFFLESDDYFYDYDHEYRCIAYYRMDGRIHLVVSLGETLYQLTLTDFNHLVGTYWVVVIDYHR